MPCRRRSRYSRWNRRCSSLPSSDCRYFRCQSRHHASRAALAHSFEQYRHRLSQRRHSGNSSPQRGQYRIRSSSTRWHAPPKWTRRVGRENQKLPGPAVSTPPIQQAARSRHLRAVVYGGAAAYASTPTCIRSARNPIPTLPEPAHPRARHDRVPALLDDRSHSDRTHGGPVTDGYRRSRPMRRSRSRRARSQASRWPWNYRPLPVGVSSGRGASLHRDAECLIWEYSVNLAPVPGIGDGVAGIDLHHVADQHHLERAQEIEPRLGVLGQHHHRQGQVPGVLGIVLPAIREGHTAVSQEALPLVRLA
jgi:hypothetical protein